jgi:hypothetical protein
MHAAIADAGCPASPGQHPSAFTLVARIPPRHGPRAGRTPHDGRLAQSFSTSWLTDVCSSYRCALHFLSCSGYYCQGGCEIPCAAGRYNPDSGSTSSSACRLTPKGHWAATGSSSERRCAAGQYGDETGMTTPLCSGDCFAGTRCLAGTVLPEAVPLGKWSATAATNAYDIPRGMQCGEFRTDSPSPGGCKNLEPCTGGHVCPQGRPFYYCPAGFACPVGTGNPLAGMGDSGAPQPCPPGTWSPGATPGCIFALPGQYVATAMATGPTGCGGRNVFCSAIGMTAPVEVPSGDYSTDCTNGGNCKARAPCDPGQR